jgi:hypothetical protein
MNRRRLRSVASLLLAFSMLLGGRGHALSEEIVDGDRVDKRDQVIQDLLDRVDLLEREVQRLRNGMEAADRSSERASSRARSRLTDEDLEGITAAGKPSVTVHSGSLPSPAPVVAPKERALQNEVVVAAAPVAQSAAGAAPAGPAAPPATAEAATQKEEEEEREVTRVPLAAVERGGTLLRPGNFQIEPSFSYSHNRTSRLILTGFSVIPLIILGTLESEKLTHDSFTTNLGLRYGLIKDVQLGFRLPFSYLNQSRVRLSSERVSLVSEEASEFGLGDIEMSATYQPIYERGWLPDVTTSLSLRAPTGRSQFDIFKDISRGGPFANVEDFVSRLNNEGLATGSGFWALSGSVSMVKALDPAVLFGTIGYSHSFGRRVTLVEINQTEVPEGLVLDPRTVKADLQPGDTISFGLGVALALNSQFSINFSFSDSITFKSQRSGRKIDDSQQNVAQFTTGFTLALRRGLAVDFRGGIGLTPDAPDFVFTLALPMTFNSVWDLIPFRQRSSG